jgi:hypothetical protein
MPEEGPHFAPELPQIRLAEAIPLLIKETPAANLLGGAFDSLSEAGRSQHSLPVLLADVSLPQSPAMLRWVP